ncbi:MAG: glycoside hydrolase family 65 protein [Phycisphaeraceae bacterium]
MKNHQRTDAAPDHPRAYLANGLIGLRLPPNPLLDGHTLVNGFVGQSRRISVEAIVPAPYPLSAELMIDNTSMWQRPDLVRFVEQRYDFACGELTTHLTFTDGRTTARLEVLTFCCRPIPSLVMQQVRITVDRPCELVVQAVMDPSGLPGEEKLRAWTRGNADAVLCWESRGGCSTCGAAFSAALDGVPGDAVRTRRNDWGVEADLQLKEFRFEAKPVQPAVLRQVGALIPSIMHAEPHWHACRMLEVAAHHGFDELRRDNQQAWSQLWRGRPVLIGAETRWQDMVDSAFFYLHSSIHPSMPCSVAPFALSQHRHYEGHVFWDTETFMLPPTLLTDPPSARAMLDYRAQRVDAARHHAALNGYRGIQFPLQSGSTGHELTVPWATGGVLEHHFTLDVALAFLQYAHATGDRRFLREQAWPVLAGTAEWLASRFVRTERGYEARHLTGTDELRHNVNVNNNAHFNILAISLLREATALAKRIGEDADLAWAELAERIVLPVDGPSGVILKHDAWRPGDAWGAPEVPVAYSQCGYIHSAEVDDATLRFYVDNMAADYAGMPMETGVLTTWAARFGKRALARQLLQDGFMQRMVEPFDQWKESTRATHRAQRSSKPPPVNPPVTVFVTAAGALLESLLLGMPGLHVGPGEPASWQRWSVALPEGWDGIEVERLWIRGRPARLRAVHSEPHAEMEWLDAPATSMSSASG